MINENGGYKVLEVLNLDNLWTRIEKDFHVPVIAQTVEYQTPRGTFSIEVTTSDRRTDPVILIYKRVLFTYHNSSCGHDHDGGSFENKPGIAQFCKSVMKVTYKENSSFDTLTKQRIETIVKKHNDRCAPGVSWLNPGDYPGVSGFIMQKQDGTLGTSQPTVIRKDDTK